MSGINYAFVTNDAGICEQYREWDEQMVAAHNALDDLRNRYDPERRLDLSTFDHVRFAFFHEKDGSDGFVPVGFRRTHSPRYGWVIVPDKRLKAGKLAAAEIKAHAESVPKMINKSLRGMPGTIVEGDRWKSPAVRASQAFDAVYVGWTTFGNPADVDTKRIVFIGPEVVDLSIWRPLKLSEFYSAVEESDAASAKTKERT